MLEVTAWFGWLQRIASVQSKLRRFFEKRINLDQEPPHCYGCSGSFNCGAGSTGGSFSSCGAEILRPTIARGWLGRMPARTGVGGGVFLSGDRLGENCNQLLIEGVEVDLGRLFARHDGFDKFVDEELDLLGGGIANA